jgi:hypothetical protein
MLNLYISYFYKYRKLKINYFINNKEFIIIINIFKKFKYYL